MIRLAIVEDHAVVAQGLAALLEDEPDMTLVGTASDLGTARALLEREQVDVVVCDVVLSNGEEGLRLLAKSKRSRPAFIMFSAFDKPDYHARAVELGAAGYMNKMVSIERLTQAIRTVAAGGQAFQPGVLRSARSALPRPSPRQLEVIALVAEGRRNEEIGRGLSIQTKTVEGQLQRLFDRYSVPNRTALVRLAEREGWIEAPAKTDR
jgi:DNA-binding NarL/FixJ family response regulator